MVVDFHTEWSVVGLAGRRNSAQLYEAQCPVCRITGIRTKHQLQHSPMCRSCSVTSRNKKHGYFGTRIYQQWADMLRRCTNPKYESYSNYGGRGISVCPQWTDFTVFLADMGECPDDYQLDRKDNNGNYEPSNCHWASRQDNTNNRRVTTLLTIQGKTQPLTIWARDVGLPYRLIASRIRDRGWSAEEAVFTPSKGNYKSKLNP